MIRTTKGNLLPWMIAALLCISVCQGLAEAQSQIAPEKTLGSPPELRELALQMESLLVKEGKFAEARDICQQRYDQASDPETKAFWLRGLAESYKVEGKLDSALAIFKQVLEQFPQTQQVSWATFGVAECYHYYAKYFGKVEENVPLFMPILEKFIKDYPNHYHVASALYGRGWGYEKLGNDEAALPEYQKAVDLYPNYPHADFALGALIAVQRKLKRWDDAIASARRYIELFPQRNPAGAQLSIGMCYAEKGDFAAAIKEFDKVLAQYPGSKDECALAQEQKANCEKKLSQAVQMPQPAPAADPQVPADLADAVARGDLAVIESHMKALYNHALQVLEGPAERENLTVIDAAIGYAYRADGGIRAIERVQPDENGVVTFSDGTQMITPRESREGNAMAPSSALGGCPPPEYDPYRSVVSKGSQLEYGYNKVQGYVTVPTAPNFTGVDFAEGYPEGAFNYFGVLVFGANDIETGICSQANSTVRDNKRWYIYHSISAPRMIWLRDGWPAGGIPPGGQVFMSMSIPADNQVVAHYSYGGGSSNYYTYNATGPRWDGWGQCIRRNTSMVLRSAGNSVGNFWQNVGIGKQFGTPWPWYLSDTNYTIATNYVYVNVISAYDAEFVDIRVP